MTTVSKSGGRSLSEAFGQLRRRLGFLTEEESRLAYLEDAKSAIDLEMRMRELDRRTTPNHLYGFASRG
jgi:hypothetical protein